MLQLYMTLVGATPPGRHTEQHDVYFGIGNTVADLLPGIIDFWPECKGKLHLDAWRPVTLVNGYSVRVVEGDDSAEEAGPALFFLNLGGYKRGEFDEFHYRMIVAAADKGEAVRMSKETAFFRHTGFKGATAHIDDKWGVDVDDAHAVRDILPKADRARYRLVLEPAAANAVEDELALGYFKLDRVEKWAR